MINKRGIHIGQIKCSKNSRLIISLNHFEEVLKKANIIRIIIKLKFKLKVYKKKKVWKLLFYLGPSLKTDIGEYIGRED